jgi:hypothetical protein
MSSTDNQYNCKVFLKNLWIQQEIKIDNNTQIVTSPYGYTCYDSATYMKNYLEIVTGEQINIDIEKLAKNHSENMPVTVIKLWNIKAPSLKKAAELAVNKSQPIIKFLTYNQGQSPEIFGVTSTSKEEGTLFAILPSNYCGRKHHLMSNLNKMAFYVTSQIGKDERLNLFLTLFSDAVSEKKLDFKIVKLWTILETMAASYKGQKEKKVRALLTEYQIGVQKYQNFDLIKLAYMHRNAVVHEGTSDPEVVSSKYARYLSVSSKNMGKIVYELQELVSYVILWYMRRNATT